MLKWGLFILDIKIIFRKYVNVNVHYIKGFIEYNLKMRNLRSFDAVIISSISVLPVHKLLKLNKTIRAVTLWNYLALWF